MLWWCPCSTLNRKTGQWKQNYHHQDAFHRADIRHHLHLLESVPIFIFSLDNNLDRVRANYLAPALFENTPPAVQASVCYHPMKTSCPNVQKKKKKITQQMKQLAENGLPFLPGLVVHDYEQTIIEVCKYCENKSSRNTSITHKK